MSCSDNKMSHSLNSKKNKKKPSYCLAASFQESSIQVKVVCIPGTFWALKKKARRILVSHIVLFLALFFPVLIKEAV